MLVGEWLVVRVFAAIFTDMTTQDVRHAPITSIQV